MPAEPLTTSSSSFDRSSGVQWFQGFDEPAAPESQLFVSSFQETKGVMEQSPWHLFSELGSEIEATTRGTRRLPLLRVACITSPQASTQRPRALPNVWATHGCLTELPFARPNMASGASEELVTVQQQGLSNPLYMWELLPTRKTRRAHDAVRLSSSSRSRYQAG